MSNQSLCYGGRFDYDNSIIRLDELEALSQDSNLWNDAAKARRLLAEKTRLEDSLHNFEHLEQGYAEMFRVLRKGGVLSVIELSTPRNPLCLAFYKFYTRCLIPVVGRMVSKDTRAYSYLPESIAAVPQGEEMLDIMRRAGFANCRCYPLTFGTSTIYMGEKA